MHAFPALFSMRNPEALTREEVQRVLTCYGGKDDAWPSFTCLHVTVHRLPPFSESDKVMWLLRRLFLLFLTLAWVLIYPRGTKLRCVLAATIYSFIEFTFVSLERGKAFTSLAQLVANLVYTPVLLDAYGSLFFGRPAFWWVLRAAAFIRFAVEF